MLLAGSVFWPAGLCRSFVTALPLQPTGPDLSVPLHLKQFAAKAAEQSGCLQPASTRWLRWPCRFQGISDAPMSSGAVYPASAFRQTVFSAALLSSSFRNDTMTFMGSISALSARRCTCPPVTSRAPRSSCRSAVSIDSAATRCLESLLLHRPSRLVTRRRFTLKCE